MLDIKIKHCGQKSKLKYVKLTPKKISNAVKYLNPTVRIPRVVFFYYTFICLVIPSFVIMSIRGGHLLGSGRFIKKHENHLQLVLRN